MSEQDSMPKIYCFCVSSPSRGGDVEAIAMAEDGSVLAGHISSNEQWAKHDIGYAGPWKHEAYAAHYPNGYELLWCDRPPEEVLDRNKANSSAGAVSEATP